MNLNMRELYDERARFGNTCFRVAASRGDLEGRRRSVTRLLRLNPLPIEDLSVPGVAIDAHRVNRVAIFVRGVFKPSRPTDYEHQEEYQSAQHQTISHLARLPYT